MKMTTDLLQEDLERALEIEPSEVQMESVVNVATNAHWGQKDFNGVSHIFHVLHIGLSFSNDNAKMLGFLHDVVEDTPHTITWVQTRLRLPEEVIIPAFGTSPDHLI